jgi:hypothetical protein
MNKRISKKLAKMAPQTIERVVRDFTVQEAFDKVIQHLTTHHPDVCYFVDKGVTTTEFNIHGAGGPPIITAYTKTETEWPLWDHKIEPEEVTFYCQSCTGEITAQQDVDNDGECDRCIQGQNEMWAKEKAHEAYEYRDMKL